MVSWHQAGLAMNRVIAPMRQGAAVGAQAMVSVLIAAIMLAACASGDVIPESTGTGPGATEVETPSVTASVSPAAPADPRVACEGIEPDEPPLEIAITARSFAYDTELIEGPRHCQPFVIVFTNKDPQEHDLDIRADGVLGPSLFDGELARGEVRYDVPGLPAGEHYFYCSVHAGGMNGTLIVSEQA